MKSRNLTYLPVLMVLVLTIACGETIGDTVANENRRVTATSKPPSTPEPIPTASSHAPLASPTLSPSTQQPPIGSPDRPLVIALPWWYLVGGGSEVIERTQAYWSQQSGLAIEILDIGSDLAAIVQGLCSGNVHAGPLPAFYYILASESECAEAEAVWVVDGSPTYTSQIISADNSVTTVADIAGKRFCYVDTDWYPGWIIPTLLMRASGVNPDEDLDTFLVFMGGRYDSLFEELYAAERCNAAGTYVDAREAVSTQFPDIFERVRVIATGGPIPHTAIVFAPEVPNEVRLSFLDAFESWYAMPENADSSQGDGLEAIDNSGYQAAWDLLIGAGMSPQSMIEYIEDT